MEDRPQYGKQDSFKGVQKANEELLSQINALSAWTGETEHARKLDEILNIAKAHISETVEDVRNALKDYEENNTDQSS